MNKTEAKTVHRKCLAALTDTNVRNLMEHAANKTLIVARHQINIWYKTAGAGCPAQLAGLRLAPSKTPTPIADGDPRCVAQRAMQVAVGHDNYYNALRALADWELRRLWLAEGRKRGYEVN